MAQFSKLEYDTHTTYAVVDDFGRIANLTPSQGMELLEWLNSEFKGEDLFTSEHHKRRFLDAMLGNRKVYNGVFDQEYAACFYILTEDEHTWKLAQQHIEHGLIDMKAIIRQGRFSSGYGVLIRLAGNLLNGNTNKNVLPVDLMKLDESTYRIALNAMKIRRYGIHGDALLAVAQEDTHS